MTDQPIFDLQDTWDDNTQTFHGIQMTVVDTGSTMNSRLLRLVLGGDTMLSVDKEGNLVAAGTVEATVFHGDLEGKVNGTEVPPDSVVLTEGDKATAADLRAAEEDRFPDARSFYDAAALVASSGTGTWTIDLNAGRNFQRTLNGASTVEIPTNRRAGQSGLIYLNQDATGGHAVGWAVSGTGSWAFIGGLPSINTAPLAINVFSYFVRSTSKITITYLGSEAT